MTFLGSQMYLSLKDNALRSASFAHYVFNGLRSGVGRPARPNHSLQASILPNHRSTSLNSQLQKCYGSNGCVRQYSTVLLSRPERSTHSLTHGIGNSTARICIQTRASPLLGNMFVRFASKKAQGSAKNGRNSRGRRLGLKKWPGQPVERCDTIITQRGTKWRTGQNVGLGRDHTIYALAKGHVYFTRSPIRGISRTFCHVLDEKNELYKTSSGAYVQVPVKWTEEEDEQLIAAVSRRGRDWNLVAKDLGSEDGGIVKGKHARHCRNRANLLHQEGRIPMLGFPERMKEVFNRKLKARFVALEKLKSGGHNPLHKRKILQWGRRFSYADMKQMLASEGSQTDSASLSSQ